MQVCFPIPMHLARLKAYGTLARIELAGFSFVAVIGGFTAAGTALPLRDVLGLFVANVILVIFGFVHNDYMDVEIDRLSREEIERPLVDGAVSRRAAGVLSLVCMLVNPIFVGLVFQDWAAGGVLLLAQVLAGLYNIYSKKFPGADIFYAVSAGLLCLSGALAVLAPGAPVPPLAWIVIAIMFTEHLFFNIVAGGMKDLTLDCRAGVKTLVLALSRWEGGTVRVRPAFRVGTMVLKVASILLVFTPFAFLGLDAHPVQLPVLVLLAAGAVLQAYKLLSHDPADRKGILDLTRKEETLCKALVPVMLISVVGLPWALTIVMFPILWFMFFNLLLHGALLTNPRSF